MSENLNAKKILVADDSLTIQKVIRLALSGDGYEIQTVSDGKEALEQASLFRPDIFIIDVSLPVFDAYQVREQLLNKPDLKNIPVILMSSAFEKVDEARSKNLGFSGHLINLLIHPICVPLFYPFPLRHPQTTRSWKPSIHHSMKPFTMMTLLG